MKTFKNWPFFLLLIVFCTYGCNDDKESGPMPFDPAKEVVITSFTPESGAAYQQLLIYGENFGNNPSIVTVTIGGQEATVVSANGTNIYCFVPTKAYTGKIEVTIDDGTNQRTATIDKTFTYKSEMMVGTLCGYRTQEDRNDWITGPFETCYGFRNDSHMNFDRANKNHLYIGYDNYSTIQVIDLERREVRNSYNISNLGKGSRVRSVDFTKASATYGKAEGQYMVISIDFDGDGTRSPSVYLVERNAQGTFDNTSNIALLAAYKQCNGATVHPVNGEIYFNSYDLGQVFRVDPEDYWADPSGWNPIVNENPKIEQLYTIADPSWEFKITFHPSGTYAFINVINQNYIMRTDYNSETKRLVTPYVIAGGYKQAGYTDGVGTSARFNKPYQGVFVKNEEYVTGEQYDYYVTEANNHCIRKVNPDGIVSTYAGRGSNGYASDNNYWGADDGALRTQARFRDPFGMAYDPDNNVFYIHAMVGRTIRTISMDTGEEEPADSND